MTDTWQLRKGQESAQAADISTIKEKLCVIFQEISFEPPVDPSRAKEGMGFNQPQCAELLRPFNVDWNGQEYVLIHRISSLITQ